MHLIQRGHVPWRRRPDRHGSFATTKHLSRRGCDRQLRYAILLQHVAEHCLQDVKQESSDHYQVAW
jgi:hypothetical protein